MVALVVALILPVAVACALLNNAVEHNAQDLGFHKGKLPDGGIQRLGIAVVLANHQQNTVGQLGCCQGIAHFAHRGKVKNHIVILLTQMPHQALHTGGAQQFHGVGGHTACSNHMECVLIARNAAVLQQLIRLDLAGEVIGKAGGSAHRQILCLGRTAHIAVDQQHTLAQLGNGVGQVCGRNTLAFAGKGAGHTDHMAVFLIREGELQLGTQQLVSFRRDKTDIAHQCCLFLLFGRGLGLTVGVALIIAVVAALGLPFHVRHHGQHRVTAGLCHILFIADGHIHQFPDYQIGRSQQQAQGKAQHGVSGVVGRTGAGRHHSGIHDLGRSAFDNAGNPLGQDIGNGVGDPLSLQRVLTGNGYPENFRVIHSCRRNHISHFAVRAFHARIVNHSVDGFSGLQNDNVRLDQAAGRADITGADTQRCFTQGYIRVIDIEHSGRLVSGGDQEHGSQKHHHRTDHSHQAHQPGFIQQYGKQSLEVNLHFFIVLYLFLFHDSSSCGVFHRFPAASAVCAQKRTISVSRILPSISR